MSIPVHGQQIDILDITEAGATKVQPAQQDKIYVRSVKGKIESLRRVSGLFFLVLFLALPWISYAGQQAILLDFGAQRFHLFSLTLWPQDLTLFAWLFIISAFALFFVTTLWGRVWCGFMCPQTVFTFLFVWVEEKVEGARNKRIHLDRQPLSARKVVKKSIKHGLWLFIAFITAFTFVGYFTPIKALASDLLSFELAILPLLFLVFFMFCTYGNAGWMREIMCTHMCPYSRFQSSMFDNDTVTVTYDSARGEGRGPRSKKMGAETRQQKGLGDCIDCNLCVQVCPTGIDIRNGLQYECINCGACVDACNGVMTKMEYEKDLISFTSANALEGKPSSIVRPKVIGYFLVFVAMIAALSFDIAIRKPLDIDVIRDRNSLYRETLSGGVENVYTLAIMNKTQSKQVVTISVSGLAGAVVHGSRALQVEGGQLLRHPITVEVDSEQVNQSVTPIKIKITNENGDEVSSESTFIYRE